ncbi:AlpA family phage regulatory protein [Gilvimarinus agarilyticus]|uniref:helix-turn-helix transcriptional regulator n=1 Tax=Gilvimarinus sp. 2_MG-2023 TaxID=3062666 RepID=UPI001C0A4D6D|nr:AlpA family phage regulatory protein [Gilvimarinus sp. 2_MG-2023]MBU2886735.1 AlpA family phage regulatory protein [Gilvimarinus agarilyticus]MDO6571401.1 AlpA family phage regulatory protein [Gilvimarinus sp. 2_MG-2023]
MNKLIFLLLPDVQEITGGKSRSTIWRWVRSGQFPQPVRLAGNTIGWPVEAIQQWRDSVINQGGQG